MKVIRFLAVLLLFALFSIPAAATLDDYTRDGEEETESDAGGLALAPTDREYRGGSAVCGLDVSDDGTVIVAFRSGRINLYSENGDFTSGFGFDPPGRYTAFFDGEGRLILALFRENRMLRYTNDGVFLSSRSCDGALLAKRYDAFTGVTATAYVVREGGGFLVRLKTPGLFEVFGSGGAVTVTLFRVREGSIIETGPDGLPVIRPVETADIIPLFSDGGALLARRLSVMLLAVLAAVGVLLAIRFFRRRRDLVSDRKQKALWAEERARRESENR